MSKSITHFFEHHMQYGDLQLGYNNFERENNMTFEDLEKMINLEEEDYPIA